MTYTSAEPGSHSRNMQSTPSPPASLDGLTVSVNDFSNAWPTLRIAQTIPLGRLEWLWTSRGASIRDSSTSARALFDISSSQPQPIPNLQKLSHEWFRNPYVYIVVTTIAELGDSNDAAAWLRIRQFVGACREELHEFLIVVAASESDITSQRRLIEKLRNDVNPVARGRERVVVVPPASIREEMRPITHLHHSPSHQDLLVRLRECMRDGVEARIRSYEEEVSRSYLSKESSSWSYCIFMALKEGMAFVFVQLGRRDLAVKFYDELHIAMVEPKTLAHRSFCDISAAEEAQGVVHASKGNCRDRLIKDIATEMDIRTYLFARQSAFLLADRKFSDVAERGLKFITAIARRCAEEALHEKNHVTTVFRDIWVFTAAQALAATLAPAIPTQIDATHALSVQLSTARERHTARLIAGFHVHALKAFLGLAQVALPGCLGGDEISLVGNREEMAIEAKTTSNEKLKTALSCPKKAETLHSEIANAAASLYEMGGRARGAAALDGDAGMVRLENKSYTEAESLLGAQCSRFSNDTGWDDLHRRPRLELAKAEKELTRIQEYLVSCLTMLYMTRRSRQLGPTPAGPNSIDGDMTMNAAHWVKEAAVTASRLPRVMKYRADRLVDVSVLPNVFVWNEGDSGSATVRVKSDLPDALKLDRIVMELRCPGLEASRRSALNARSRTLSSLSASKSGLTAGEVTSSTNMSDTGERLRTVTLYSKESVTIDPGNNEILVSSLEIPVGGQFKVTSVALFIGNLKLVQAASRVSTHPIVTTKGENAGKISNVTSSMAMLADLSSCEVRFPIFYASRRKPSAWLHIDSKKSLYLAPESIQFIPINIQAGENGVAQGSRVVFALLNDEGSRSSTEGGRVHLRSEEHLKPGEKTTSLPINRSDDNQPHFTHGEAVLDTGLKPNETYCAFLAIEVRKEKTEEEPEQELEENSGNISCLLQVRFSCREMHASGKRVFFCQSEATLEFFSPIEVTGLIQVHSVWDGDAVSRAAGLDGTPLRDGGTLQCDIMSQVCAEATLTIKEASLETPSWLELRPDEVPAHNDLLPCTMGPHSVFSCIFDVLERDQDPSRIALQASKPDDDFGPRAAERLLSRQLEKSANVSDSQDELGSWSYEIARGTSSSSSEELVEQPSIARSDSTSSQQTAGGRIDSSPEGTRESDGIIEEEDMGPGREAKDVVDLFTPTNQNRRRSTEIASSPTPSHGEATDADELATLRIYVEISRTMGITCLERKIYIDSFRVARKRYRIERYTEKVGKCGLIMDLKVGIRSDGRRCSYSKEANEETGMQYEVDADPNVWWVVGKRRGMMKIQADEPSLQKVQIVPLTCGWHHVPCLRLFTSKGQALPLSRFENVNEFMEVAILPCATVMSACTLECRNESEKKTARSRSNLPVVIASDSFFES